MFLEYSENDHQYYTDGKNLPSVTELLNRAGLISDFCKNSPQATWRGQSVHTLTSLDDRCGWDLRRCPAELRGYMRAWRLYRKESGFVPNMIEGRVDCLTHGYSGRYDRLGYFPNSQTQVVLDLKTSATGAIAPYVKYQLVAYGFAVNPNTVFQRVAVGLRPDGQYRVKAYPVQDYACDLAEWLQLTEEYGNQ